MADTRESMSMCKLFIGGLNKSTTDEEMNEHFIQFGHIKDLVVMKGDDGGSRGFGFITYKEAESVEKVFAARPITVGGKVLDPKRAMPKELGPGAHPKTNKLFLGGIPKSWTDDDIRKYIEGRHKTEYGTITKITIIKDRETQESKGYAFLEASSTDFADRLAISEADFHVGERKCQIKKAEDKEGFSEGGRGGRGGGRGGERGGFSRGGRGGDRGGRGGDRGGRGSYGGGRGGDRGGRGGDGGGRGGRGARGGERGGGARGGGYGQAGGYGQGTYGAPYGQSAYGAPAYHMQAQDQ